MNVCERAGIQEALNNKGLDDEQCLWEFRHPQKYITSDSDVRLFRETPLFHDLIDFLNQLSSPVKGFPLDPQRLSNVSSHVRNVVELLDTLDQWVDEIAPIEEAMRFGNRAFQTWFDKLQEVGSVRMAIHLTGSLILSSTKKGRAPDIQYLARFYMFYIDSLVVSEDDSNKNRQCWFLT